MKIMNTRRSFLRSCIAAVIAAPIVCRMADALPVAAEKAKEMVAIINPEWEKAPYELAIVVNHQKYESHLFNRFIHERRPEAIYDPYPLRFEELRPMELCTPDTGFDNQWKTIHPFIYVERE